MAAEGPRTKASEFITSINMLLNELEIEIADKPEQFHTNILTPHCISDLTQMSSINVPEFDEIMQSCKKLYFTFKNIRPYFHGIAEQLFNDLHPYLALTLTLEQAQCIEAITINSPIFFDSESFLNKAAQAKKLEEAIHHKILEIRMIEFDTIIEKLSKMENLKLSISLSKLAFSKDNDYDSIDLNLDNLYSSPAPITYTFNEEDWNFSCNSTPCGNDERSATSSPTLRNE